MNNILKTGIMLGRKHYAKIIAKGERWKQRNIPVYIREHLLVPYYITEENACRVLYVIQFPTDVGEKVHFLRFDIENEKESSKIPDNTE